jgi:hypothetical protein
MNPIWMCPFATPGRGMPRDRCTVTCSRQPRVLHLRGRNVAGEVRVGVAWRSLVAWLHGRLRANAAVGEIASARALVRSVRVARQANIGTRVRKVSVGNDNATSTIWSSLAQCLVTGNSLARPTDRKGSILLRNSKLPALAKQITPMRRRPFVQRPAGPTAIEIAPASLCVTLRAIDATRATFELHLDVRRTYV